MALQPPLCEPWPYRPGCCSAADEASAEDLLFWREVATSILFNLSGRRWGPSCPQTVRPCRRKCLDDWPITRVGAWNGSPWIPYIGSDGLWRNASVCGCRQDCSCTELCEVRLEGPVYDVLAVEIDGEALPASAYRVDAAGLLTRTDGGCWPDCQDMGADLGAEGKSTFGVTYRIGLPLDSAAIAAFSALVCHLIKGCGGVGACGCRLPQNVTRVQRQGVTQEMADPTELMTGGLTGVVETDRWLAAVNPQGLTSPSRVWSPDYRRPRTTTWP
jgi:hypothetical protein